MGDDVGDSFEIGPAGQRLIDEQQLLPKGHRPHVFHRSGGEVRNGQEVELEPRIGDAVILIEVA